MSEDHHFRIGRTSDVSHARAMEAMMSGHYSRFSFDPRRNYSAVLQQQGRVLLDQDWNEQSAIASRGFRAAVVDLVGRVFLATPDAFKVECDGRILGDFRIGTRCREKDRDRANRPASWLLR
jgi:hypothetical protein